MPSNQRKVDAPEVSYPYYLISQANKQKPMDVDEESREERKVYLKMGVVSQAKGSAYAEFGKTKLIASVLDPREQQGKRTSSMLDIEFKYATFSSRATNLAAKEKLMGIALKKALQPAICWHELANFQIDVTVYVLEDDGCILSTAIVCAGLALMNGGVPMYDILTSSCIAVKNQEIIPDPTRVEEEVCGEEEEINHGILTASRLESQGQTSEYHVVGYVSSEILSNCKTTLADKNKKLAEIIKNLLITQITKSLKAKNDQGEE